MKTRVLSWAAALILAVVVLGASAASAGTVWTGATNRNWSDIGNWDAGAPTNQDVNIGGGANQPVVLDANDNVNSLTVGTVSGPGTLNVAANNLTVVGALNIGVASPGAINLSGGSLTVSSISPRSGGATFNFTGGTLTAGSIGMSLTNAGGILSPGGSTSIATTLISGGLSATNVAAGRQLFASQSSDPGWGGVPGRAVDGNTNGNWAAGSVTHTGSNAQEWWKVDLGTMTPIGDIKLWNRTDCCGERLSNFHVSIFDASGTNEVWRRDFFTTGGYPTPTLDIPNIGVTGQWVQVQLNGQNFLSLAEVQVYPIEPANYTQQSNGTLALKISGNTADQLSVGGMANLAGTLKVTGLGPIFPGTFRLLNWVSRNGTFANVNLPTGHGLVWDDSALYTTGSITALPNDWKPAGGGTWNDAANWRNAYVPSTTDDVASLLGGATSPSQVTVDTPVTVGAILLDNANKYTIAGPEAITLQTSAGNASMIATNGNHEVSAPLVLATNLQATVSNTNNNFTLSGPITDGGAAKGITKSGLGTLTLSGTAPNTYSGDTTVNAGKLVLAKPAGTPAVGGNLIINPASGWPNSGVELAASEQLAAGSVVRFTGSDWSGFRPQGFTQTVAGIDCTNGRGVVENARDGQSVSANGTLIVNNDADFAYNGYIRNGGANASTLSLVKGGTGMLTLSGTNITYTGSTTINAGTLKLTGNHNVLINSGSFTVNSRGTFTTDTAQTTNGPIVLHGGELAGIGTGDPTWGTWVIRGQVHATADSSISALRVLPANSASGGFNVDSGVTLAVSGTFANTGEVGTLTKTGPGTMLLTNASIHTGGTVVNAGTLQFGDGATSNGSVVGSIANKAAVVIANASDQTFGAAISGTGSVTKTGPNTLTLAGRSTYTGPTTISGGTLLLRGPVAPPTAPLAGSLLWLDASNAASITGSGASMQWADSGLTGNYLTVGGGAPALVANALDGKPVVDLGPYSSGTWMQFQTGLSTIRSAFWVMKGSNFLLGSTTAYDFHRGPANFGASPTDNIWDGQNNWTNANIRNGQTYLNGTQVNGTATGLPGDYSLIDVITSGNVQANDLCNDRFIAGRTGGQQIAEILIYDTPLSDTDRQAVEAYLQAKWHLARDFLPSGSRVSVADGAALQLTGVVTQTIGSLVDAAGATGTGQVLLDTGSMLTVGADNTSTTFKGSIQGGGALGKTGTGTFTITNAKTYTGGTTVNGGQLKLDFSGAGAPASDLLSPTSPLMLGGGTLSAVGASGATNSQTFAGLTVNRGASSIATTQNAAAAVNLTLGAIARTGGTLDFTLPTTGSVGATTGTANQILLDSGVAYATVSGNDWAAKDTGNAKIVGLSTVGGYTPSTPGNLSGNADVAAGVDTTLAGDTMITSVRFNQNQGRTINLGGYSLTTGGILISSNVNTAGSIITGGTLKGPQDRDLVIIQNSPQPFTIEATIPDNASLGGTPTDLTKSGSGALVLAGTNAYTGTTRVNAGVLSIAAMAAINSGISPVVLGSGNAVGTLQYTGSGESLTGGVTVNPAGGQIESTAGSLTVSANAIALIGPLTVTGAANTTVSSVISGSGPLVKSGVGTLEINSQNNFGFTGSLTVNEGTLLLNTPNNAHPLGNNPYRTITVNAGATLTATPQTHNPFGTVSEPPLVVVNGTFNPADYVHVQNLDMTGGLIAANATAVDGLDMRNSPTVTVHANANPSTIASKMTIYSGAVNFAVQNGAAADDLLVSGSIVGAGSINKSGPGTMVMAAGSTFTGGTTVSAGTLQLGDGVTNNGSVSGNIVNNASVVVANPSDQTLTNTISGTGGLIKTATGTLTLPSPQTYQGPTVVRGGTLKLQWSRAPLLGDQLQYWLDASNPASADPNSPSVSVWNDVSGNFRNFATNGATAPALVSGALNGLPVVRFDGATTRLNYAGDSPNAQTVFIVNTPRANNSGLDGIWGWLGVAGQQDVGIRLTGSMWQGRPDGGGNTNDYTVGGVNGTTYVTTASKFDANTCNFGGFGTPHILTAYGNSTWNNTAIGEYLTSHGRWYQGDIAEILVYNTQLDAANRQAVEQYLATKWLGYTSSMLPAGTALSVAKDAVLDLNGVDTTVGSLADDGDLGGGTIKNDGTFDSRLSVVQTGNSAFSGSLTDGATNKLSLLKDGPGKLTLSGPNTYSGGTTVNGGTLEIAAADSLPAGRSLIIGAGDTVVLSSGLSAAASGSASQAAPVPEPGTLVLVVVGSLAIAVLRLRRRI